MFRITPVYDLLLRGSSTTPVGLYHLHLATAEQLTRLHYKPGSINKVKARLKDLANNGFLQADGQPTKKGKGPYYYVLAQQGLRYLEEAGYDTSETFRANREGNKHALFVEHTLELNDVLIAASLLEHTAPCYRLESFIHERALKWRPYKAVWKTESQQQTFTVIPDAFLDFRSLLPDGRQRRMPLLLEHDRGTEEQQHFRRRIRAYLVFFKSGAYQQHFGVRTITVAFTTFTGIARLRQMIEWTRAELAATNEPKTLGTIFSFTTLERPLEPRQIWLEQRWYTSYPEDGPVVLLAG